MLEKPQVLDDWPKGEILKHLDGDLVIVLRPSTTGEWRAEISGRAKADRPIEVRFE
jgi:hypothetical protein